MEIDRNLTGKQKNILLWLQVLLILSVSAQWLLPRMGLDGPAWLGAILAMACLLGMLAVFWRAGALRGWILAAFVSVLIGAPLVVWLASHT